MTSLKLWRHFVAVVWPRRRMGLAFAALLTIAFVPARADNDNQEKHAGAGRMVFVGDSLAAGFQNFALYDSDSVPGIPLGGQKHSFATFYIPTAYTGAGFWGVFHSGR